MLGCIVPWLTANQSCSNNQQLGPTKIAEFTKFICRFGKKFMAGRGCTSQTCPPPCHQLLVKAELTYQMQTQDKFDGRMFLDISPQVKETKHVIEYGGFHLVVDVGSSLGLWIGLSILGLYDLMLDLVIKFVGRTKLKP